MEGEGVNDMRQSMLALRTQKKVTPLKAIREKCLDCSGWQPSEVRKCPITACVLFPYRFGHNPQRRGVGLQDALGDEKPLLTERL